MKTQILITRENEKILSPPSNPMMRPVALVCGSMSFLFLLISTILMISSNCTVPMTDEIYFIKTTMSTALARQVLSFLLSTVEVFDSINVRVGLLGYCINDTCSEYRLGYKLPALFMGGPIGQDILSRDTTTALVINPLFTAFSCLCLMVFLITILLRKPIITFVLLLLNTILGLVCLIINLSIFISAYWLVQSSATGSLGLVSFEYGNALWLLVTAVILTIFSTVFSAFTLDGGDQKRSTEEKKLNHNNQQL